MNDTDTWRSADLLIKQHGDDAEFVAAQRSDALLERGDTESSSAWNRIRQAIRTLREGKPRDGETVS